MEWLINLISAYFAPAAAVAIGVASGVGTVILAILHFFSVARDFLTKPRSQRLNIYRQFSADFSSDPINRVQIAIENGNAGTLTVDDKVAFWAFFEELALTVNSGLMRIETADYMFGYYLRASLEDREFMDGMDINATHWALLRTFEGDLGRAARHVTSRTSLGRGVRLSI